MLINNLQVLISCNDTPRYITPPLNDNHSECHWMEWSLCDHLIFKMILIGQIHHFKFHRMKEQFMRGDDSVEPSAAVRAAAGDALLSLAVDVPSTVVSSTRTTLGVASARSDSPREYDPSLEVDYECESDEMADSGGMHSRLTVFRRLIMSLQMRGLI